MDGADEITMEFLVESREYLDQLDRDLIVLEKEPTNKEIISGIFRAVHTIKGTCGFLGFNRLEKITHVGENVLSRVREGELPCTPNVINALLMLGDAIRAILEHIETNGNDGTNDYPELVAQLKQLNEISPEQLMQMSPQTKPDTKPTAPAATPPPETPAVATTATPLAPPPVEREPAPASTPTEQTAHSGGADSTIRVDVELLDNLMNIVGELVLARNQILQYTAKSEDNAFLATSQRLNIITTELQEAVMKTRMQPIGNIWNKFPRVIRDISATCGKQVRLEMDGKATELDKTLLEAIKDPLTHLVRNAVDHGIESPVERLRTHKPEEGCLTLRAFHEGGQVNIEIEDDGAGIAVEKIRSKAIEKNLVTPEQANSLSDRDIMNMIFLPGFSTAAKVTNISGRGVGMDVVKTNIEKIGGTIDIQSQVGRGTKFIVKIPLTLAIIPALTVVTQGQRFAIPQVNLVELLRLSSNHAGIEHINGVPVYRLRGSLLPIVYLNEVLELNATSDSKPQSANIVVLSAEQHQFGLVVDSVQDNQEIVVKPLSKQFKGLTAFAGATIMGDGKVALILDALGIAHKSNVIAALGDRAMAASQARAEAAAEQDRSDYQVLLIVSDGKEGRMAIPLSAVARLENIEISRVEQAGSYHVVQYRNSIMPLIYLDQVLDLSQLQHADNEYLPVVVYSYAQHNIGLVVGNIIDIVEERLTIQSESNKSGILMSTVVQGRVTQLLDMEPLIRRGYPAFFEEPLHASRELPI